MTAINSTETNATNTMDDPGRPPPAQSSPTMTDGLAQRKREIGGRCTAAAQHVGKPILFGMTTSLMLQAVPIPLDCATDAQTLHTVSSSKSKRLRTRKSPLRAHTWAPLPNARNVRINQWVYALDLFHTWAQLAGSMPLGSLIALGDAIITAVSRRPALAKGRDAHAVHRDLLAFTGALSRFNGKAACERAAIAIRPNVDSLQETECRLMLLSHGLPEPTINYTVPDMTFRSGAAMTLDLAWPERRVALEYDGDHHRTEKAQWRRDQEKRDRLRNAEWIVMTATGSTLTDEASRGETAFALARHLAQRGEQFTFHVLERPIASVIGKVRKPVSPS